MSKEFRLKNFDWFFKNIHSLLSDTVDDPKIKDFLIEFLFNPNKIDIDQMQRVYSGKSSTEGILNLCTFNRLEKLNDKINNENLLDFLAITGISNEEQFKNSIFAEKFPSLVTKPEAYEYVVKIINRSKEDVVNFLKKDNEYNLNEAYFEENSPNKNILINVKKKIF